ncbi:MAG: hypothetical protein JEZ11_11970 [Desulfobacterales bacterium]|nr:hypothetical protein [Desulfobacterales bacterium]
MTPDSIINKRLVALFLLGCVLFNYPILSLVNVNTLVMGIPLLYLYLFAVWAILIGLVVWITPMEKSRQPPEPR